MFVRVGRGVRIGVFVAGGGSVAVAVALAVAVAVGLAVGELGGVVGGVSVAQHLVGWNQ